MKTEIEKRVKGYAKANFAPFPEDYPLKDSGKPTSEAMKGADDLAEHLYRLRTEREEVDDAANKVDKRQYKKWAREAFVEWLEGGGQFEDPQAKRVGSSSGVSGADGEQNR